MSNDESEGRDFVYARQDRGRIFPRGVTHVTVHRSIRVIRDRDIL